MAGVSTQVGFLDFHRGVCALAELKKRKRGRPTLDDTEKKTRRVDVWVSEQDLRILDEVRGARSRSEAARKLIFGDMPRPVPEINYETNRLLAKALGNVSSLAAASRRGGFVPESELVPLILEVRSLIITAKTQLDEGDEE